MNLMKKNNNSLTPKDVIEIAQSTDGYSGADLKNLCADAAMTCLRELSALELENIDALKVSCQQNFCCIYWYNEKCNFYS